ncbi:cation:proton antiporter [Coraliomargarita sp. SDUM461004]|uniref:Cation:proton antiporter n=1 Tax=Thalassobacterium sedimentorum TaxID=3041258 RepID=A0ABU1AI19_9BACT|nr:cation:proton antiporter [Coraliomargarita sp. SDUM461004]MDQ8194384.1 cation:proton antiporter [Coraliomargarita sp. SDUM461004]
MHAPELTLLLNLGFIVITAAVFAFLGKLVKMPSIVAYILAGMVLGPGLGIVQLDHSLELISELGIALLLFLVGLELSLQKIKDLGRVALILGGLQVVFTASGGFLISLLMGFGLMEAVFLAATVTFSSTVVVIKLLDQKGATGRLFGRIAISLFLAQDIVVIIGLTILSGLGSGESIELLELAKGLGVAFGGMIVLLLATLLAARYVLPKPFAWASRSPDTVFIWALCWCFLVVLLAHQFHLSVEIGAFLAGIAIAQLPIHEDLHRRLHPLMTFFVAVFLVTLGVKMDLSVLGEIWGYALGLSAFVIVAKPLIVFLILSRLRYSEYTAFQTAIASGQVSEFAFILLGLGAGAGLIEGVVVSLGGLVGILTIAISSYLIIYSEPLYTVTKRLHLLHFLGAKQAPDVDELHSHVGHVIVVGMNALGREVVKKLSARGEIVLAIDTDPRKLEGLGAALTLIGNVEYESVVEEIGLRHARLVVSALQIEDTNHLLAYRCRSADVPCAIHAFDISVVDDLLELDTNYMFMPAVDGVREQVALFEQVNGRARGEEVHST